jgi:hypothetical protein
MIPVNTVANRFGFKQNARLEIGYRVAKSSVCEQERPCDLELPQEVMHARKVSVLSDVVQAPAVGLLSSWGICLPGIAAHRNHRHHPSLQHDLPDVHSRRKKLRRT